MAEIYGVHMSRPPRSGEVEYMLSNVSEERRAKAQKYVKPDDAHRSLIAEYLIRAVIRSKLHLSNAEISFVSGPYGKPRVGGIPSFHFNIAHSGAWIVCAVDSAPVGIDVEEIKPMSFDVAQFFSEQEIRWLMSHQETARTSCFYDLWTLKESYIKWVGTGLSLPLNSFSIMLDGDAPVSVQPAELHGPCFLRQMDIAPGYKMAVCSTKDAAAEQIIIRSVDELLAGP
ncbi:4'-phosphopantetheinyl transferase family protein [Paenibacillus xerothermodurans]|uniref:4'-phosphopantetheinyl transferase n=1 Tax=Paenibacillus xerothermodurans TaxID=1977292 RepID=A0A2W1NSL9_PAEXE|nr:4'-phosphopantetheinyl transferase superfamily protein [Paenibacillus xerothermodurans]PZE21773.1 4'-phosphopantetheinyl transferase [Paenibacillus xerothermodurans]